MTFGELQMAISAKANLLFLYYLVALKCCLLYFTGQNCLLTFLLRTVTQNSSLLELDD